MLSTIANHFLSTDADKHFAHRSLEEADLIYGGTGNTGTAGRIVNEAENRGLNLANLTFSDIESEDQLHEVGNKIEGKSLFYRHKSFSEADTVEEKIDILEGLNILKEEYDVELINDPLTAMAHDSKTIGNKLIEENLSSTAARTTEQYSSSEAREKVEERPLVLKPDEGMCGDEVVKAESVEEIDSYLEGKDEEEVVFEEYIPHDLDLSDRPDELDEDVYEEILDDYGEHITDGRAYIVDGELAADTARENDEGLATNLAKGGAYTDPDVLNTEQEAALAEAAEGLDFAAVDYVQTEDELIIYEVNATPGTDYEDEVGGLIEPLVDMLDTDKKEPAYDELTIEAGVTPNSPNYTQKSAKA